MNLSGFGPALLAALLVSLVSDWFLVDFMFAKRRHAQPQLWRLSGGSGQASLARLGALALNLPTCAIYLFAAGFFGLTSLSPALMLAISFWLAIALPLIARETIEMRVPLAIAACRALAWLLKLLACSLAAYYFL